MALPVKCPIIQVCEVKDGGFSDPMSHVLQVNFQLVQRKSSTEVQRSEILSKKLRKNATEMGFRIPSSAWIQQAASS